PLARGRRPAPRLRQSLARAVRAALRAAAGGRAHRPVLPRDRHAAHRVAPSGCRHGGASEAVGRGAYPGRRAARRRGRSSGGGADLAAVGRLWHEPEEVFLAGLYGLLLNRDMDDDGKAHYLAALRGGATRAAIVRSLALSAEARQSGRPVGWLDDLERGRAPW